MLASELGTNDVTQREGCKVPRNSHHHKPWGWPLSQPLSHFPGFQSAPDTFHGLQECFVPLSVIMRTQNKLQGPILSLGLLISGPHSTYLGLPTSSSSQRGWSQAHVASLGHSRFPIPRKRSTVLRGKNPAQPPPQSLRKGLRPEPMGQDQPPSPATSHPTEV